VWALRSSVRPRTLGSVAAGEAQIAKERSDEGGVCDLGAGARGYRTDVTA